MAAIPCIIYEIDWVTNIQKENSFDKKNSNFFVSVVFTIILLFS